MIAKQNGRSIFTGRDLTAHQSKSLSSYYIDEIIIELALSTTEVSRLAR